MCFDKKPEMEMIFKWIWSYDKLYTTKKNSKTTYFLLANLSHRLQSICIVCFLKSIEMIKEIIRNSVEAWDPRNLVCIPDYVVELSIILVNIFFSLWFCFLRPEIAATRLFHDTELWEPQTKSNVYINICIIYINKMYKSWPRFVYFLHFHFC